VQAEGGALAEHALDGDVLFCRGKFHAVEEGFAELLPAFEGQHVECCGQTLHCQCVLAVIKDALRHFSKLHCSEVPNPGAHSLVGPPFQGNIDSSYI
jgi:hypothetical protein